jgi:hypothetical protein
MQNRFFLFCAVLPLENAGDDAHIAPINPELHRQLRLALSNRLSHKNYFQIPV